MKNVKTHSAKIRILSFVLTLLLIFYIVPMSVFAETADSGGSDNAVETSDTEAGIVKEVFEVTELREESVKHFKLEDGSYLAAAYNSPVHYKDEDGAWQDIDNRLLSVGSEYSTGNARVKFSKKITGNGDLFTLHENNTKLTMGLVGAEKKTAGIVTSNHSTDDNEETRLGKLMNLENLSSSIIYEDVLDGVDIEYILESVNIKENIIVKERGESYSYIFTLSLNNLTATLSEDGSVNIINSAGETAYVIPAPIVFDSANEYAPREASEYSLTDLGNSKYYLTVAVSAEWMNSPNRIFPVTVDPTISQDKSMITDLYTDYNNTTTTNYTSSSLVVSYDHVTYWKTYSLPIIPTGAYLTNAEFSMYLYSGIGNYIGVHQVTSDWNYSLTYNKRSTEGSGAFSTDAVDYVHASTLGRHSWNITEIARKWYTYTATNYGFCFLTLHGTSGSYTSYFYSNDCATASYRPSMTVSYVDMRGVEDYLPAYTHSAGLAGDVSVNLATGYMKLALRTLSSTDYIMPYTPTLVYDRAYMNYPFYTGSANTFYNRTDAVAPNHFKLNIQETLVKRSYLNSSGVTSYFYIYSDADGTEHYLFPTSTANVYTDEDGLRLRLTVSTASATLTYTDKTVKTFTSTTSNSADSLYLTKITDKNGNAVSFTFDNRYRPLTVVFTPNGLSAITMLNLKYTSTGRLYAVINNSSKEAVILRFSEVYNGDVGAAYDDYLREVIYAHGDSSVTESTWENFYNNGSATGVTVDASASYTYDMYGRILRVADNLTGRYIDYSYNVNAVSEIKEYGNGGTQGQTVIVTYGSGYADIRSSGNDDVYGNSDDIINRYILDTYGRIINTYSTNSGGTAVYGGVSGKYDEQENSKNSIKETANVGGSSSNYILNGEFVSSFGETSLDFWTASANVSATGSRNASMLPSASSSAYLYQYVALGEGDYTLSLEYNASACTDVNMYLKAISLTNTQNSVMKEIPLDINYETNTVSASMTFSVPSGGDKYQICIEAVAGASASGANITVDNIMLEKAIGVGPYNFVRMGHFENSNINSSGYEQNTASSFWLNESSSSAYISTQSAPFGRALQISSYGPANKYAKQRIYTAPSSVIDAYDYSPTAFSSNAGYDYLVSGYAYATGSVPSGKFGIRVDVYYYQGYGSADVVVSHRFDFQDIPNQWQFVSGSFSGEYTPASGNTADYSCIRYIDVVCEFSYQTNGNYAFFDNISVTDCTEGSAYRYYYYENGNLARKASYFNSEYYYYDANDNLITKANDKGELYEYTYNTAHNLTQEVYYTFTRTDISGSTYYPYWLSNPESVITKTPETLVKYTYNIYSCLTAVESGKAVMSGSNVAFDTSAKRLYELMSYEHTSGSKIFGAMLTYQDADYTLHRYLYDTSDGKLLATANQNAGTATVYTYDTLDRIIKVTPATYDYNTGYSEITDAENVNYTYNNQGYLSTVSTDSTTYTFTYDVYGNTNAVNIGSTAIASYEYNSGNGKLKRINYANGFSEEYVYNALEMLEEIWYNYSDGTKLQACEYIYTNNGQLHRTDDLLGGRSTVYDYNSAGKLVAVSDYETADMDYYMGTGYTYNKDGRVSLMSVRMDYLQGTSEKMVTQLYGYTYDEDGRVISGYTRLDNSSTTFTYTYDELKRISSSTYTAPSGLSINSSYTYHNWSNTYTTGRVETYTSTVGSSSTTYTYTYDGNGNITKIVGGGTEIRYVYDDLGQLVREDNGLLNKTTIYSYDNAGNITQIQNWELTAEGESPTIPLAGRGFAYTDTEWGDKMTALGGNAITYDALGNMLSASNYTYTWNGRLLTGLTYGSSTASYEYNSDGIRTSKTVNGVKTVYYLSGTQIIAEDRGDKFIVYLYDANGSPIGMKYRTTSYAEGVFDTFWFEKNLFGDIIAVYSDTGTLLVSYVYDAWGSVRISYHNGGISTGAQANRFMYRGYYYDAESELYYLNSRYYNPYLCRFISPDGYVSTGQGILGNNMYAYCNNNPVMYIDPTGEAAVSSMAIMLLGGTVVGMLLGGGIDFVMQLIKNGQNISELDIGSIMNSTLVGGALGFSGAMGVGYLGPVIAGVATYGASTVMTAFCISVGVSAIAGGGGYIIQEIKNGNDINVGNVIGHAGSVALESAWNFGVGGMVGSIGKIGTKGKSLVTSEWYKKLILTQEFSQPFKYIVDKFRKNVWR